MLSKAEIVNLLEEIKKESEKDEIPPEKVNRILDTVCRRLNICVDDFDHVNTVSTESLSKIEAVANLNASPSNGKLLKKTSRDLKSTSTYTSNPKLLLKDLSIESQRLLMSYLGYTQQEGVELDWQVSESNVEGVSVYQSMVAGCSFKIFKCECTVYADKYVILDISMDDNRFKEYNDNIENFEVKFRYLLLLKLFMQFILYSIEIMQLTHIILLIFMYTGT